MLVCVDCCVRFVCGCRGVQHCGSRQRRGGGAEVMHAQYITQRSQFCAGRCFPIWQCYRPKKKRLRFYAWCVCACVFRFSRVILFERVCVRAGGRVPRQSRHKTLAETDGVCYLGCLFLALWLMFVCVVSAYVHQHWALAGVADLRHHLHVRLTLSSPLSLSTSLFVSLSTFGVCSGRDDQAPCSSRERVNDKIKTTR